MRSRATVLRPRNRFGTVGGLVADSGHDGHTEPPCAVAHTYHHHQKDPRSRDRRRGMTHSGGNVRSCRDPVEVSRISGTVRKTVELAGLIREETDHD
jgi:hypothetical protein